MESVMESRVLDFARWKWDWTCEKWSQEAVEFCLRRLERMGEVLIAPAGVSSDVLRRIVGEPEEVVEVAGNLLLNAGIQRLEDLLIGAGGTAFNNANSRLGVGNSNTAEVATQTDLSAAAGAANRQFKVMNATFPSRAVNVISWASDFLTGEANFAWAEWGIDNGTVTGTTVTAPMLNRKVAALGTKATGTWTLTGTLTIT